MNRVSRYGWIMILGLLLLTACSGNPDGQSMRYEHGSGVFSLQIPKSWEGHYVVEEVDNQIVFVHRASKPGGILFFIEKWPKDKWEEEGEALSQNIPLVQIGEMDDVIYSWSTPTDVQYNPDDEASKQEYLQMFTEVESIKNTFLLVE